MVIMVCLCVGCSNKRRHPNNLSITGIGVIPHQKPSTRRQSADSKMERKAIMEDSNSETSEEAVSLPYVTSKENKCSMVGSPPPASEYTSRDSAILPNTGSLNKAYVKDRSLTVMIPRAKYHPAPPAPPTIQNESQIHQSQGIATTVSICSTTEAKLLSYLDISPSVDNERYNLKKKISSSNHRSTYHNDMPPGALVSAGFEVSATVGLDNDIEKKIVIHKMNDNTPSLIHRKISSNETDYKLRNLEIADNLDRSTKRSNSPFIVVNKTVHNHSNLNMIDNMSDWLTDGTHNDGYLFLNDIR